MIKEIKAAVTIPVMAKARIGHFVEAQILEACGIDYIDESEVGGGGGPPRKTCAAGSVRAALNGRGVCMRCIWRGARHNCACRECGDLRQAG
jgi:hypothetical protein